MDDDPGNNSTIPEFVYTNAAPHNGSIELALLQVRRYSRHLLPVLVATGIIGNFMALLLIRTNFWLRRLTSNIYLCTLSICGCLFLSTVLLTWADSTYNIPIYNNNEVGCKFFTFLAHFCDFICVWMISWISCDRMIVLFRPGIRKWVCTKKFARRLTIGTIIAAIALYGWCLLFAGIEHMDTGTGSSIPYCGLNSNASIFGYRYDGRQLYLSLMMIDTGICTILPSVLIMVVNSFSTYRYRQCMKIYASGVLRVRFLRTTNSDVQVADSLAAKRLLLSQTGPTNNNNTTATSSTSTRTAANCGKLRSSDLQLSRSLLVVTSTFVLLNVPNYILRIVDYIFNPGGNLFSLLFYLTFLLYYLHHAVLFYMYIFWSPQMKKQLRPTAVRLLECYCFKTVPEFGHRSTSLQAFQRN